MKIKIMEIAAISIVLLTSGCSLNRENARPIEGLKNPAEPASCEFPSMVEREEVHGSLRVSADLASCEGPMKESTLQIRVENNSGADHMMGPIYFFSLEYRYPGKGPGALAAGTRGNVFKLHRQGVWFGVFRNGLPSTLAEEANVDLKLNLSFDGQPVDVQLKMRPVESWDSFCVFRSAQQIVSLP